MRLQPAAHDEFWHRLAQWPLERDDRALSFARRLGRENGWTLSFAQEAILEYKKFVYLAVRAKHPVTPSPKVDQVWHLHLSYTKSYWEEMCGEILKAPLHHNPTAGGETEDRKYLEQYKRTLSSYEHAFGGPPPAEFWPEPKTRFEQGGDQLWVHRNAYWLIPKPDRSVTAVLMTAMFATVVFASNSAATESGSGVDEISLFHWIVIIGGAVCFTMAARGLLKTQGNKNKKDKKGGFFGGCGSDGCGNACGGGCGS